MRIAALLAASMAAATLARVSRPDHEMTDEERKTPRPPAPEPEVLTNLPGETNRQFAARMKAAQP